MQNQSGKDLESITARIEVLTAGVRLDMPVTEFFIARFEAGSEKHLSLPLVLPRNLSDQALDLRIHFHVEKPEGHTVLPLRVPLNSLLQEKR